MGNADAWPLSGEDKGAEQIDSERRKQMDAVREWTLRQLTRGDREFIAAFQPTAELPLSDGRTLLGFHGSPHSFDDVILPTTPDEEVRRLLGSFTPNILAGGHTHVQQIRHLGQSFYFGCGSAGFAYRHDQPEGQFPADPWGEYAVLTVDGGHVSLELRRVPFDVEALIGFYRASGRPYADEAIAQDQ